jgi:tRNA A-37 threonylcarbamoyl transferase component Bud32
VADRLLTTPAWAAHAVALHDLPAFVAALPDTACFYRGRNRLYRCTLHGEPVVIKRFQAGGNLLKRLAARVGRGKALRTFAIAERLIAAGIATPAPLAALECRSPAGAIADSYYVCVDAGTVPTLRELTFDPQFPARHAQLEAIGELAGRLHAAGCDHRDLSPGNLVFAANGPCLVDLNRVRFQRVGASTGLLRLLQLDVSASDLATVLSGYRRARPTLGITARDHTALVLLAHCRRAWRRLASLTRPLRRKIGA